MRSKEQIEDDNASERVFKEILLDIRDLLQPKESGGPCGINSCANAMPCQRHLKMKITKEDFEKGYAQRSHVDLQQLKKWGLEAIPCECNYEDCQGWQMVKAPTSQNPQKT